MAFGALNMLVGNLLALRQTQVKRLLAYSSLTHVGYMLVGLGIALYAKEATGAQGGLFHLLNHGLMKGLAFLAAGALLYALHIADGRSRPADDRRPGRRGQALSAGGAGASAWRCWAWAGCRRWPGSCPSGRSSWPGSRRTTCWIEALIVFAALNSVLSLAYYAPLVNAVYRQEPSAAVQAGQPLPALMTAAAGGAGLARDRGGRVAGAADGG